jgi:predicted porin
MHGELSWGTDTNFDPALGPPVLANSSSADVSATIRPVQGLTIDNSYLLTRLQDQQTGASIFNNHIIRSKWNYQFTRALSLRVIGQYSTVLSNPALTSLQNTKNLNADVLVTYLVHPGTAVYVGYNSNLQNLDSNGNLLRTQHGFINDGRQFFVKVSYLFRY